LRGIKRGGIKIKAGKKHGDSEVSRETHEIAGSLEM